MLKGENIYLRAVEPEDVSRLLLWENNPQNWKVSDTEVPFSVKDMLNYVENQQHIRSTGQLRLMICLNDEQEAIGAIDLYDANFKHLRAGIGILIADESHRAKGYASESLSLLIRYSRDFLGLYNLHCSIHADNDDSVRLFEKFDFERVGIRKDWYFHKGERIDEILYQKCLKK